MTDALFTPLATGGGTGPVSLDHRIVLAPLTRNRGTEPELCAHAAHVEYYSQRATPGGLLITEATSISPEAVGYVSVPGIWTDAQTEAWKPVTAACHAKGAKIFMQMWHTGRIAQPSFGRDQPLLRDSGMPLGSVSSSASVMAHPKTGLPLNASTYAGVEACAVPRALETEEIARVCEDYKHAARNALKAGFDGVEIHAAHGYLIDQFIQDGVNKRTDKYGGSVENRCRFLNEAVAGVCEVMGPGRTGVRLAPTTIDPVTGRQNQLYFGASSTDPDTVYEHAAATMNNHPLAYLLLTEPRWSGRDDGDVEADKGFSQPLSNQKYRKIYNGTLMAAGGFTPATAADAIANGDYDMIGFGRWFISNPDLVDRIKTGAPFNVCMCQSRSLSQKSISMDISMDVSERLPVVTDDRNTFYPSTFEGGGAQGYTDYPDAAGTFGAVGKYDLIEQANIGATLAEAGVAKL